MLNIPRKEAKHYGQKDQCKAHIGVLIRRDAAGRYCRNQAYVKKFCRGCHPHSRQAGAIGKYTSEVEVTFQLGFKIPDGDIADFVQPGVKAPGGDSCFPQEVHCRLHFIAVGTFPAPQFQILKKQDNFLSFLLGLPLIAENI